MRKRSSYKVNLLYVIIHKNATHFLDIGDFIHSLLSKGSVIVLFNFHIAFHLCLNFSIGVY
jgi:hypothetical protein